MIDLFGLLNLVDIVFETNSAKFIEKGFYIKIFLFPR